MKMIAKAEKTIRDGWYEAPSPPRQKVDEARIRQIIERDLPSRQKNEESNQGDKSPCHDKRSGSNS